MGLPTPSKSTGPLGLISWFCVLAAYLPVQMIVVFISGLAPHIALVTLQL